ncbi:uncharacterized protein LOC121195571 [Toxotes jaculatrix]|uniref:uncharacterized protein LOC121195571 n=1 Tax=Toxotes jaculatrix TaxID=941984 RepID=UPI001B3A86A2|nr:uncharacterized protein LOC121195571 [Toxotes jaculatrix]
MSSEKSPEVVGCDASIMKNVWEIRVREYRQKLQLEQERIEKSALPSINQDWANRLVPKLGNYKRVERKTKTAETDINDVWKSKQPQVPPALPRGAGSGPFGRPGGQSRGFTTQAPNYKDKKGQDKNFKRLQSLMFITQTQPSAMVWGKSWKYNKCLPSPAEGTARSDWGQCWMFATQQPYSEAGKPWPNGPNMMDPNSLHLWKKPDCRVMESKELELSLPTEEWQMSWRKSDKNSKKEHTSSVNGENVHRSGYFNLLLETQHLKEALCSSEWNESWRSTKPASQQEDFSVQNDGLVNESVANKLNENNEMRREECWRIINHLGCNKSQLPQVQKSHSPKWANSWRAATVVFNNHKNSDPSLRHNHSDTYDGCIELRKSHLQKGTLLSHERKHSDLQFYNEFQALPEWSESWQVTKNNSKPCEEIEKVLKTSPPRVETVVEAQKVEENPKGHYSKSEKADPYYEQLKHNVIYCPRRELTQSKLHLLKHVENVLFPSEWTDSWKTLKHRMRMERRRMRSDPFRESEKGEWKDSWKVTCQPLHQEPELWQQSWSTTAQSRVDRSRDQNHFAPVEVHKNGPTVKWMWGESWRFLRHPYRSEHRQDDAKASQGSSSVDFHHPDDSQAQRRYARSVSDWQVAWMVSESQLHHDKPSLTQWRESWKWSVFHTEHSTEQVPRENGMGDMKTKIAKAKMNWSFDNQMFRERYPEEQWSTSWRAGSLINHQLSHYGSSGVPGKNISSAPQQQHTIASEHGSKWGRSFRLANPMPHVEQPWVESSPNLCHYTVMWLRVKNIQSKITNFSNNPAIFRLWGNSHQFLQEPSAQIKGRIKSKELVDPRVIIAKNTKTRRHLFFNTEKEKQSERKWAGCHLLGKTQPRPKKGSASVRKIKVDDETKEKFLEEWAESWRFLVHPGSLKKQIPMKSLSGWTESWKFLLPL